MPNRIDESGEAHIDRGLQSLIETGRTYCENVDNGIQQLYGGHLSEEQRSEISTRHKVLDICTKLSEMTPDDMQAASLAGLSPEELADSTHVLETVSNMWMISDVVEVMNRLDRRGRALVMSYFDNFSERRTDNMINRAAVCLYLQNVALEYTVLADQELEQTVSAKRAEYTKLGLTTQLLDKIHGTEIYMGYSMFSKYGSSGHASWYPKSAVVYMQFGNLEGYGRTVMHERWHQLIAEVHQDSIPNSIDFDEILRFYSDQFTFNEVLVDLYTNIENPSLSGTDYSSGVMHLAHILEAASIKQFGEQGKGTWRNYLIGLLAEPNKKNLYTSVQKWYEKARPEGYGSFIEEMLIYSDKSIGNRNKPCSTFEEATDKWSWLKYGMDHGVSVNLLRSLYLKVSAQEIFNTEAFLLNADQASIFSLLEDAGVHTKLGGSN
jgi:hypothetical protein